MKTLFKNVTVVTMKKENETYSYMGIEKDKIIYLSNEEPNEQYDRVIDLNGKFIYPGMTDSHLHLLYSIVLSASSFNICSVVNNKVEPNSIEGVGQKIKEYVTNHPKQDFIMINQYIPSAIDVKRLPTKDELDAWSNHKEIVLFNIDGHSCSVSSKLLEKLNLPNENGILTGENYDKNQSVITSYAAKKVSLSSLLEGIAAFTNNCYKYGICKVVALDGEDDDNLDDSLLSLLVFVARRLDLHVRLSPEYMNYDILKKFEKKMKNKRIGGCSRWELDGSVGSRSAAFYEPFIDNHQISGTYYKEELINKKVKEALEKHIQLTAHAIGTKAIDMIVDAYSNNEELLPTSGPLARIDHFEFPSIKAIDFVCHHKIGITIQPGYAYFDKRYIHSYDLALPQSIINLEMPLKTLDERGALLLGSSDSPVQSINPYDQILGMIDFYKEDESLSNYNALKTYTYNPSIVLDEKEGILEVNGPATFFICNDDIIHIEKEKMNQIVASAMYIDGNKMKKKKANFLELVKIVTKKPKLI